MRFNATLDELSKMIEFGAQTQMKRRLVLEEALVNVINHSGASEVEIIRGSGCLKIIDDGKFFDPTKHQVHIDPNETLEEKQIGGLGIHMMQQYAHLSYERKDGRNYLTINF